MNPLTAIGFALALGHIWMVRDALRSVLFGFAVALIIAIGIGLVIQMSDWLGLIQQGIISNSELESRGHPNLLDWFVAFISGIAAAYAMGRPRLLSALPGVAIAAALVPPIATSGLALAMFDLELSFGALLLFFTNIVAIILGTAIAFWGVGVNTGQRKKNSDGRPEPGWPRLVFLAFVLVSFLLAGTMSMRNRWEQHDARPTKKLESPARRP